MPRDPEKAKARHKRYRERLKVKKYGPEAAGRDMRGRHGNHARGAANGKWSGERLTTSQGYVAVRVAEDHPHGWGSPGLRGFRYAYEHVVVAMGVLGRDLRDDEVVHHKDGDRTNNDPANLEVLTRSDHAAEHAGHPGARDHLGRFAAGVPRSGDPAEWSEDLRVQEYPEAQGK